MIRLVPVAPPFRHRTSPRNEVNAMTDSKEVGRMRLKDVVICSNGERFSETWYRKVWRKVFVPRRCTQCGEVKDTIGAYFRGTTKPANEVFFGCTASVVEKMVLALELDVLCRECLDQRIYGPAGPPPFRPRRCRSLPVRMRLQGRVTLLQVLLRWL